MNRHEWQRKTCGVKERRKRWWGHEWWQRPLYKMAYSFGRIDILVVESQGILVTSHNNVHTRDLLTGKDPRGCLTLFRQETAENWAEDRIYTEYMGTVELFKVENTIVWIGELLSPELGFLLYVWRLAAYVWRSCSQRIRVYYEWTLTIGAPQG